jgi:phospholipid/cholesterol/gamma-HCH transport system substrate-binding protein
MESEARYTLVGAVIVALVVATLGAVVWLKGAAQHEDIQRYTIYFQRQSLDGLQVNADVTMLGISVGRVENFTVDTRTMNRVRATIRVAARAPVTKATIAVVQRNLLTGIARIALSPPGESGPVQPHRTIAPGETYPVIAEGKSDFAEIQDAANRVAKSGALALDNLNAVLTPDNREAIGATLGNVRDITAALSARMDRIDAVTLALARSAADIGQASRDVAESVRLVQASAQPAAGQAQATLQDISRAAERLERETAVVAQRVDTAVEAGSLELSATARELRATAALLARTLDRVRDPRTLLLGPSEGQLGPGERVE